MTGRLSERIALVTGASRGIGAAVAKRFAAEGAHVVLVARTRGGLEEVDDEIRRIRGADNGATLLELDLADLDKVDRIGPTLAERFGRLDILVANAGLLGEMSPIHHIEADVWHRVTDVNLHANWRLIRTLDPLLRASDAGRAVFVSSGAAHGKRPYWGAYAVTKAALEMMVTCWAAETEQTAMKINLLDPGPTRTRMRAAAYPGEDPDTLKTADSIAGTFVELCSAECERHGDLVRA
ncbi:MAG: SDR family NAD(P)-dependent oxidoreductase [Rhodospirillaceae bacterium]